MNEKNEKQRVIAVPNTGSDPRPMRSRISLRRPMRASPLKSTRDGFAPVAAEEPPAELWFLVIAIPAMDR